MIISAFCIVKSVNGQDIHFSQYYYSPLNLNPAHTGLFEEDCRFTAIYRSQWSSIDVPYSTFSGSYEIKRNIGEDILGLGVVLFNDRSGAVRYEQNSIYLSGSYQKRFEENILSFGLQGGYGARAIRTDLTFDGNYNNATGNFDAGIGEISDIPSANYIDFNTGVAWKGKFDKFSYTVGGSLFHLLQPNISHYGNSDVRLERKFGLNADVSFPIKEGKYVLHPSAMFMNQGEFMESVFGMMMLTNFAGKLIDLGGYFRKTSNNTDAAVFHAGMGFNNIKIGVSYDVNISSLINATEYYGGFEIGLIYLCPATLLKMVEVPCERY